MSPQGDNIRKPAYRAIGHGWFKHVGWRDIAVLPLSRRADGKLSVSITIATSATVYLNRHADGIDIHVGRNHAGDPR